MVVENAISQAIADARYLKLAGGTMTGNIAMTGAGTLDGRDVSADGTKLDTLYTTIGLSALTSVEVDQLENINSVTITNTQWGYLGALDQGLTVASSVEFAQVTLTGAGKAIFRQAAEYWNSPSAGVLAGVTGGTLTLGAAATNQMIVTSTGLMYPIGTGGFPHAGLYVVGNAVATTIAGAGTFAQFVGFDTDGPALDAVPAHAQDHITITKAGTYKVVCSMHLESIGAGAADTVSAKIAKNGGTVDVLGIHGHRKLAGGGGDIGSMTIHGLAVFAASDTVELWITNDDNATDILIADSNLTVVMVGGA